jgi:hypothetical protein
MKVSVTDTSAVELDEALSGLEVFGLGDRVVVLDFERCACGCNHGGLLSLWDGELGSSGHCSLESWG